MRMRQALLAGILAAAAAGPALAQGLFDDNEARRRIEMLRQQLEADRERLGRIETAVQGATDRNAMIELSSQIEALRNDIARMRGQVEVLGHQSETAEARQKQLYIDIDTRLRKLETTREQPAAADKP